MKRNNPSLCDWKKAFELFYKVVAIEIDSYAKALVLTLSMPCYDNPKEDISEIKIITLDELNARFNDSMYDYTPGIVRNLLIEWRQFTYFEDTLVAFFDIQAYSEFIKKQPLTESIKIMRTLFDDVSTRWGTGRRASGIYIPHWVFSDSLIIALDTYIQPISRVQLRLFFGMCSVIMGGAMERGLPLRGAIGGGNFCFYKNDDILISTAISNAAEFEKKQDWLGAVITPEALELIKKYDNDFYDDDGIVPFVKYGSVHWKSDSVKDCPVESHFYIKPLMNNPNWETFLPHYFRRDSRIDNSQSLYR